MDNSSNLTPPKWTTHLIYYRGKNDPKLYINYIYKPKRVILITPLIGLVK